MRTDRLAFFAQGHQTLLTKFTGSAAVTGRQGRDPVPNFENTCVTAGFHNFSYIFVPHDDRHIDRSLVVHGVDIAAADSSIELMILDSQDDINKEAANIETCITKGVDMILLISVGTEDGANCVRKANEAGVPIIAVSREVTSEKPLMNIVTGYDNTYAAIDELIDNVVVEGTVVEIAGKSGEANVIIRGDALREAIDGNENVTLIDSADCQWDQLTAANTAADMISKYPDLTAFYCHNDDMAAGVIQAVEDAGKTGEIMVIAMDGQPAALSNIAAGKQTATMGVPVALEGARCVYYAHQYLTGNDVPEYIETEIIPVTKDNVETYSNLWGDINFADYPIDVSK